jgi:uncharacterized ferritin-like protein (DUF455 family)
MKTLFEAARACLLACDVEEKLAMTTQVANAWRSHALVLDDATPPGTIGEPGRPPRPRLVHPRQVPRRTLAAPAGRAVFLHALAHIEFNAINLAWDAVYRFRGLPRDYYDDWVRIAAEEAYHFTLLRERLREFSHDYGDFDAHDGLWDMARKTAHDPLLRMALVPRVLEARGLDVTPGMIARLHAVGDEPSCAILEIILRDEITHVAAGTRWFRHLCAERALDAGQTFAMIIADYTRNGRLPGPLNTSARQAAGFSSTELEMLATSGAETGDGVSPASRV